MAKIFAIEAQSKYHIEVSRIENIEDAPEDFITKDELTELGVDAQYGGTRYFNSKIKKAMNEVLASIKPGKKSAIIKDEDLLECLKESYYSASHWVPETRRVGNRLFKGIVKKERTVPSFANWRGLVYACNNYLCHTYGADLSIRANTSHRVNTIDMYKASFNWEELHAWLTEDDNVDEDNVKWYKMMWEDSETIPLANSSK